MSGYVLGGYAVAMGTLALYGASVASRVRAARRRVQAISAEPFAPSRLDARSARAEREGDWSESPTEGP